jgi:hypothetical protein
MKKLQPPSPARPVPLVWCGVCVALFVVSSFVLLYSIVISGINSHNFGVVNPRTKIHVSLPIVLV